MENVLFALFAAILLIVSTLTMALTSLRSVNTIGQSFKTFEAQSVEIRNTSIDVNFLALRDGTLVVDVTNSGQTDLSQFDQWNVLVQRTNGQVTNLSYVANAQPGANQWEAQGIFLASGAPEVFDPGIFNPDEIMRLALSINPPPQTGESFRVIVSTPNGVTAQCMFTI